MEEEEKQNIKVSKINSAMLINITLNELWKDSFRHMRQGQYLKWNNDLDCIWTLLSGDVNSDDDNEQEFFKIEGELSKNGGVGNAQRFYGFQDLSKEDIEKFNKHKIILMKKARFLKQLENKQGKGTAYDEGEDDYMGG